MFGYLGIVSSLVLTVRYLTLFSLWLGVYYEELSRNPLYTAAKAAFSLLFEMHTELHWVVCFFCTQSKHLSVCFAVQRMLIDVSWPEEGFFELFPLH